MSVEENKARVRWYVTEVVNAHDLIGEQQFVAPELLAEGTQHVGQLFDAFPDIHVTIDDLFGEDDRVVARLTMTGTHTGPFAGAAPTNKVISWTRYESGGSAKGR